MTSIRSRNGSSAAPLALAAIALAACAGDETTRPIPTGDRAAFVESVQPVLDRGCATPTCHGDPARPFSIFSARRHRSDPARLFLDEPLTDAEIASNERMLAAAALDAREAGSPVEAALPLCKPLSPEHGGCEHVGGVVFASPDERQYRAVRAWLAALDFGGPR